MHDTEDKQYWVTRELIEEKRFVEQVCPKLNLKAELNPEKLPDPNKPDKKINVYAPDLIVEGALAELKHQTTPYFKALALQKIDSQYAVTFNLKDYKRYKKDYPDLIIYYWVHWRQKEKTFGEKTFTVLPMTGVWRTPFQKIVEMVEDPSIHTPIVDYQRRKNDTAGNAQNSYMFDVRSFECLYLRLDGKAIRALTNLERDSGRGPKHGV